jgi:putative flippase GtrA
VSLLHPSVEPAVHGGAGVVGALLGRPQARRLGRFLVTAIAVQGMYTAAMGAGLLALDAPRQAVLLIAFLLALIVHFGLNRQWVFDPRRFDPVRGPRSYRLAISAHGRRYGLVSAAVYVLTALSLGVLPGVLGVAPFLVWLATSATIGVLNFFLLGRLVFR